MVTEEKQQSFLGLPRRAGYLSSKLHTEWRNATISSVTTQKVIPTSKQCKSVALDCTMTNIREELCNISDDYHLTPLASMPLSQLYLEILGLKGIPDWALLSRKGSGVLIRRSEHQHSEAWSSPGGTVSWLTFLTNCNICKKNTFKILLPIM